MERVRYFYRIEDRRRVTVAYTYDRVTGNTSYGASMFRQDRPGEFYVKSQHKETATQRLSLRPVRLNLQASTLSEVEDLIRNAIRTHGVRGERLINGGRLADPQGLPEGVQVCVGLDPNWPGRETYRPYPDEREVASAIPELND